jgi:hypothetical protein
MAAVSYVAIVLTGVIAGIGVAAIVNAVHVNRIKHGEQHGRRNITA